MKRLLLLLLLSPTVAANCNIGTLPPGMGGPIDSKLDQQTLDKWKTYRALRVEERMLEAWDPQQIHSSYRIQQKQIDQKCFSLAQLVDIGRALFLREFTLTEGLGTPVNSARWYSRFQDKNQPAAHATSCASCHWKGGFAGGGDRVDNAFLEGDGNNKNSHLERNPIPLSGAGWVEQLAHEMSTALQAQRNSLIRKAKRKGRANVKLVAKGVNFGKLSASARRGEISIDYSQLQGVAQDLVVKPFGWQGRFATIAEMVAWSFDTHLGMQLSTIAKAYKESQTEITHGQVTAVSAFIATLPSPVIEIPTIAGLRPDPFVPVAKPQPAPTFTNRWARGQQVFQELKCNSCHQPSLLLDDDTFELDGVNFSLHAKAATPRPEKIGLDNFPITENTGTLSTKVKTSVYLFSDLKLYDMGYGSFITRPLWGLRNSAPYGFNGSANAVDQAINLHSHPQSAARESATAFAAIHEKYKADLRVFLYSLMRAPEIRIR